MSSSPVASQGPSPAVSPAPVPSLSPPLMEHPVPQSDEAALLDEHLLKVKEAQKIYANYTQEQVDRIFESVALALCMHRVPLAKVAAEETGMGVVEDKVIKNNFASEFVLNKYRHTQTCGVMSQDKPNGYTVMAEPLGVIAGIIPTTNPTSTVIFKTLLALKTRNGIFFSPHPRAKKCTCYTAKLCLEAAVKAGAPENIIGWIAEPTIELSQRLMAHKNISLILATGGPGMVKSAYQSGNPAIGVGPGNCCSVIDETADVEMAVASLITSKTFDNGMICASEQSIVVHKDVYEKVKAEFKKRGCLICTEEEKKKLEGILLLPNLLPNPKVVGQSAAKILKMAGFDTNPETRVIIGECTVNGEPWSLEKLCPTLGMFKAESFDDAVEQSFANVSHNGLGHSSVLFTHPQNKERIDKYAHKMPTGRIMINCPSALGGIGDVYNFMLEPSLTLGCGSWGGNSVSENLAPKHLLNYKSVVERRENMLWLQIPKRLYFKYGCTHVALTSELRGKQRCLIVTDKIIHELGFSNRIINSLASIGVKTEVFYDVEPDPSFDMIYKGLNHVRLFKPDVIIGLGGGSPIDAAKIMWLFYEHPEYENKLEQLCARFMDIRKRIYQLPTNDIKKCQLICIPTTSGTGSEVTPFAVITDKRDDIKYPIADYALTPDMAICDPELCLTMPRGMVAATGLDVLTHAIESYVSTLATPFTMGYSIQSVQMTCGFIERSFINGGKDQEARENMHYAATMAGIAFANAFLGVCHSCAHKLGSAFHIPHGIANALMLPHVIMYNAADAPNKYAAFPQYTHAQAKERYAAIADCINLAPGKSLDEKVTALINKVQELRKNLNVPSSIQAWGVPEKEFLEKLDEISEQAFDDQCTGSNPRYPLISEVKALYLDAYYGQLGKYLNLSLDTAFVGK
eukprot:TRINITY_DN320_c0_g1_i2.p1 TRINITY_DN320_c0_g1~~TRINITY_DN320_c0_g1_i2.p1  ORF type:complete len:942 (+),score=292.34 TRINITY_DN320_c0_g1_i2:89-2827(+)